MVDLTEEELELFTDQLKVILDAFKKIDEINTEGVEPSFHPYEMKNVLRDDESRIWDWDPLENAKHKEERHFKGPKIK